MNLSFLQIDAPQAPAAESPLAAVYDAVTEVRGGWNVPLALGDSALEREACASSVAVADCSHLSKLELHGGVSETPMGTAVCRDGAWWCPVSPRRQLVLGEPGPEMVELRDTLDGRGEVRVVDMSTAFAALLVAGPAARETFARFCALDLREPALPVGGFRPGSVVRTPGFVLRTAPARFLMLVGSAYAEFVWQVVCDAAVHLGGRPVGLKALDGREVAGRA